MTELCNSLMVCFFFFFFLNCQFRLRQVTKTPQTEVILLDKPGAVWRERRACDAGRVLSADYLGHGGSTGRRSSL